MQRYLAPSQPSFSSEKGKQSSALANLEAIYLDTSCVLRTSQIPTKVIFLAPVVPDLFTVLC